MRSKIKNISSPNVEDLENYLPEVKDNFRITLELLVGPTDSNSGDIFKLYLCTPKWLLDNFKRTDLIFARNYLIAQQYNYERLFFTLKNNFEIYGEDWQIIVGSLERYSLWEHGVYEYPKDTI